MPASRHGLSAIVHRMHDPELLQIGDVAERVGLSLRTVRYYEELGLVSPSARTDGGFRLYAERDIQRLLALKRMKGLGLSLEEMGELADLIELGAAPAGLEGAALGSLTASLRCYAARADDAIRRRERDVAQARELRLEIGEQIGRCSALEQQHEGRQAGR